MTAQGSDWTNYLDEWSAVDNGSTVTFTKGEGGGAHAVLATLSEGGVALVKRLVLGNWNVGGNRVKGPATATVTFSKTLTLAESAATYLHGQPGRGMAS